MPDIIKEFNGLREMTKVEEHDKENVRALAIDHLLEYIKKIETRMQQSFRPAQFHAVTPQSYDQQMTTMTNNLVSMSHLLVEWEKACEIR